MKKSYDNNGFLKKDKVEIDFDFIVNKRIEARSINKFEFIEETEEEFQTCCKNYLQYVKTKHKNKKVMPIEDLTQ